MPASNKPDKTVVMPDVDLAASRDSGDFIVNEKRRRLAKFALGAPVLLTLVSRPVLAGQCLSNMMSGNLSNPDRGNCSKGWSPVAWGLPAGQIGSYSTASAWTKAGFSMGVYRPLATGCSPPKDDKPDCYANGTLLTAVPSALIKEVFPVGTTMLQALNVPYTNTLTRHYITAYLNASLSENDANYQYILTKQQVLDLAMGGPLPPTYGTDVKAFLDGTW